MLLKSIKLLNFRQFVGEQEVHFSIDPNRNVSIIMGENGSGKTSFAQAFTWCLYGDTDFTDKSMLNKQVELNLSPQNQTPVKVTLNLIHNGTEYNIIREQIYVRDNSGKLKTTSMSLNVSYKKNGQQEFVKQTEVDVRIKEILPKELSKYFFFDGERIGNLSKQIRGGKSKEFAQAVRSLLGLNAFLAAMDHLKPTSKFSVIGSYNDSYDSSSNQKILEYSNKIQQYQDQLDVIEQQLLQIDDSILIGSEKVEELKQKINLYAEGEKLQSEKNSIQQKIKRTSNSRDIAISTLLKQFNTNQTSYFALSLTKKAIEDLSHYDKLDKGIPDVHERTIKFLIDRQKCICGNKIEFGNDAYLELTKALEYLPPKSIGTIIGQFVSESEVRVRSSESIFDKVASQYRIIREHENEIDEYRTRISQLDKQLEGMIDVAPFQIELTNLKNQLRQLEANKVSLNQRKGSLETLRDRLITERSELTLRDENNRKIEIYKVYAQRMYDEITKLYKEKEDEIRTRLATTINEIFKNIYEGGISLTIDRDYNIQVLVSGPTGNVLDIETSTAQSISVIFAFISGIIKLARENNSSREEDARMLESEPYPLVMDAPLSAFDRHRIKTVCDALPKVAEQVIIFIKDTDGEIASEYMGQVVGKSYFFDKKNEFQTFIMPR